MNNNKVMPLYDTYTKKQTKNYNFDDFINNILTNKTNFGGLKLKKLKITTVEIFEENE